MRDFVKLILLGLCIIGYLVGYGFNYTLVMNTVYQMEQINYIDENTFYLFEYGYVIIGLTIFIVFVLYFALNFGKKHLCSNCKVVIK